MNLVTVIFEDSKIIFGLAVWAVCRNSRTEKFVNYSAKMD